VDDREEKDVDGMTTNWTQTQKKTREGNVV
jgi:hypothetical protein